MREWSHDSASDEDASGEYDGNEEECAAFSNKPASKPGKHGTPFRESKGKRRAIPTDTSGTTTSTAPSTSTTTPSPLPRSRNQPDHQWPEPNADKSEIKRVLKEHRICFYYAYGMECPHKPCRYLHGQATLPFGYYNEVCHNNPTLAAFEAMTDMHKAYEVPMPNFE